MKFTEKELSRASGDYTVVVRPQSGGGYMVAIANIKTGKLSHQDFVATKEEVSVATKEALRWMDKLGSDNEMAAASRDRAVKQAPIKGLLKWGHPVGPRWSDPERTVLYDVSGSIRGEIKYAGAKPKGEFFYIFDGTTYNHSLFDSLISAKRELARTARILGWTIAKT